MKDTKTNRKKFEAWANSEMKKMQVFLLSTDFELHPIEKSTTKDASTSEFRYPYKDITIAYHEDVYGHWLKGDKRRAWATLLHEMIHPLTDKLYSVACERVVSKNQIEAERESLTDHLANVLIKLTYDKSK